jgi:hypothetical protein
MTVLLGMSFTLGCGSSDVTNCGPRVGLGDSIRVGLPLGEVLGQARLTAISSATEPRILLWVLAEGDVTGGLARLDGQLRFARSEVTRDAAGVRLFRSRSFETDTVLNGPGQMGWSLHASDDGTFADVGGPAYVVGADLRVSPTRRVGGSVTIVRPASPTRLTFSPAAAVELPVEGEVSIRCKDERPLVTYDVGLEDRDCAGLFDGFAGLTLP